MFTLDSILERYPLLSADGFNAKDPVDLRSRADQIDAALAYLRAGAPLDSGAVSRHVFLRPEAPRRGVGRPAISATAR